jgi:hypothetical protein
MRYTALTLSKKKSTKKVTFADELVNLIADTVAVAGPDAGAAVLDDYFALTGHHVDPEYQDVEIIFNYPKQVMDLVDYFSDINRPRPTTDQQEQQQQRKFEQGIKHKERALLEKVKTVMEAMGIDDFAYYEVSYTGNLTFDRIRIYPRDFTTELVENLKKALPAGYTMSLQVIPATFDNPQGMRIPL